MMTYRSIAVSIHQFTQRRVLLYFELDDSVVLPQYLQVYVFGFSSLKTIE